MDRRNTSALSNQTDALTSPYDHDPYLPEFRVVSIVLSTAIVLSNTAVLALYFLNKHLRSKKNFLLASLAISDLFAGSIVLPFYLSCQENRSKPGICVASAVLFRFLAISTIVHILAITMEKYVTILHPFYYKRLVFKRHLRFVSGLVWLLSLTVSLSSLTWLVSDNRNDTLFRDLVYFAVTCVFLFLFPLGLLIFAQVRMFRAISKSLVLARNLRRSQRAIKTASATTLPDLGKYCVSSNRKALGAFALMLGTFVLSWMTWYTGAIMSSLGQPLSFLTPNLYNVFLTLVFLPSLVNPLLYTYYKHDFRKALYSYIKPRRTSSTVITRLHGSTLTIPSPSSR